MSPVVVTVTDAITAGEETTAPAAFGWSPPATIYSNGNGTFSVSGFDIELLMPECLRSGLDVYVDAVDGLDTNDGLTASEPKQTLYAASRVTSRRRIHLADGVYDMDGTVLSTSDDIGDMAIIGTGGAAKIRCQSITGAWALDASATYYVTSNASRTYEVWDLGNLDTDGYATRLTVAASVEACKSTAGTQYHDASASRLYVHRAGGGTITDDVIVGTTVDFPLVLGPYNYYLDNVTLEGGHWGYQSVSSLETNLWLRDVVARYQVDNGHNADGFGAFVGQRIGAERVGLTNGQDGISFGNGGGVVGGCKVLLIDCWAIDCASSAAENSNGLTCHDDDIHVVDINGRYARSGGPVVAFVGTARGWFVGTHAIDSTTATDGQNRAFHIQGAGWLDHCEGTGCLIGLADGGTGDIYTRGCTFEGTEAGSTEY